jgi:hypothetical protein
MLTCGLLFFFLLGRIRATSWVARLSSSTGKLASPAASGATPVIYPTHGAGIGSSFSHSFGTGSLTIVNAGEPVVHIARQQATERAVGGDDSDRGHTWRHYHDGAAIDRAILFAIGGSRATPPVKPRRASSSCGKSKVRKIPLLDLVNGAGIGSASANIRIKRPVECDSLGGRN